MSSKPQRSCNRKPTQPLSIFGYISGDTLNDTKVIYGVNSKINLEVYSIAIIYFPDITPKSTKISLKVGDIPQITLSIKLKSRADESTFLAFCKELIKIYKLEHTNISLFYKINDTIVSKKSVSIRQYTPQMQREHLQFINDD